MEKLRVYEFLEKNKDFFVPNSKYSDAEIENALMNAPSNVEHILLSTKFRSPTVTYLLATYTIVGDRIYLGDFMGGLLKIITVGGLGVLYFKEKKTAKSRCRELNCEILFSTIRSANR